MKMRHVEAFHAVMLTGSVSAAARLMNVTQPAVTRTLQHAELQLGFPLFDRSKSRLVPTREAVLLYVEVDKLFKQLGAVQKLAANLRTGTAAQIKVLMVPTLGQAVLPRALALFRDANPDIPVAVRMLNSSEIVTALSLREADIGFAFGRAQHPALSEEILSDAEAYCVAPKGTFADAGEISLLDLIEKPVVMHDLGDHLGAVLHEVRREAGVEHPAGITVQTYHAALALAQHGIGSALVDAYTAASADINRVDVLKISPPLAMPIRVLRVEGAEMSVQLRRFVECFRTAASEVASNTMKLLR
ncbi:LysR family transcriptional regulator [Noviherbaspirillum cavernae]|uniref:LysR family transcriptional regulator n=1 Tax=Noviherbaspirillum cavernae TaxID=2320862 RepID=A0A418WWA3_9BURK|nr:LysR family transcriptional regulator [Noviherbaspirillum cavernae]RJF96980.1 LysR family transcriptional regulator [Noviherbaspirillum cavernae]